MAGSYGTVNIITTLLLVISIIITMIIKFNVQSKSLVDWVSSGVHPLHQVGN